MLTALQAACTRWTKGKSAHDASSAPNIAAPRQLTRAELPPASGLCLLTRLGADEAHSILQLLPLDSLALVSATCRQLRADALHPASGRFLATADVPLDASGAPAHWTVPVLSPLSVFGYSNHHCSHLSYPASLRMIESRVFRTHLPVCLHPGKRAGAWASSPPLVDRCAMMQLAESCAKITQLELTSCVYNWCQRTAMQLLTSPSLRQVSFVHEIVAGSLWITNERVQIALLSLPALTRLDVTFSSGRNRPEPLGRFSPRAFAQAPQLREVRLIDVRMSLCSIAALAALPNGLRTLRLSKFDPDEPCPLFSQWGRVASALCLDRLESLQLVQLDLSLTERSWVRRCFQGMPRLQRVRVKHLGIHALLQGLIDAGVQALPALRIVEWSADSEESEQSILRPPIGNGIDLPRKLLRRFPLVSLHLWEDGGEEERIDLMRAFSGWDRVCIRRSNVTDAQAAEDLAADLATLRQDGIEFPPNPPQPCASDLREEWVEEVPDPSDSEDDEDEPLSA